MTSLTSAFFSAQYQYSATQNNGQIISGEGVQYTYDSLNRLIAAATTDPTWGQAFTYDGFGNRTGATQTKGTAPYSSWLIDPATNRISGFAYDANGNMLTASGVTGSLSYDVENRLISAGGDAYAYAPNNKRIWKQKPNGGEELYFYGIGGQKLGTFWLGTYTGSPYIAVGTLDLNVYFGSRTIVSRSTSPTLDLLGSNRTGLAKYFPYGEEQQVTGQDKDKFATYYRDGTTGMDYAQNRYYANTMGRFLSPDPYKASAGPSDPQSWNQYAYVSNDPVNYYDPYGLFQCNPNSPDCNPPDMHPTEPPKNVMQPRAPTEKPVGGGGGGEVKSALQKKWDALSEDCQNGLRTSMPKTGIGAMLSALDRANVAMNGLVAATNGKAIDWTMLGAIGIRESGFRNITQIDGNGVGIFQIDLGINTSVTQAQASDVTFAAGWAANLLATNMTTLAGKYPNLPNLNPTQLLQATASSYNFGTKNISGNPDTIDVGTTGNNYGSNVLNLMDCFH